MVLPPTIWIVLPPVLNDLIYMLKDSALLSAVLIIELTAQTNGLTPLSRQLLAVHPHGRPYLLALEPFH